MSKKKFCPLLRDYCKQLECAWYTCIDSTQDRFGCSIEGLALAIAINLPMTKEDLSDE